MLLRGIRQSLALRALFVSVVCLVLSCSIPVVPPIEEDATVPAMVFRAPSWPVHALAEGSSVRLEKEGQTQRFALHKPSRTSALTAFERAPAIRPQPSVRQQPTRLLPRKSLPSRHTVPRAPDDSADPLLS